MLSNSELIGQLKSGLKNLVTMIAQLMAKLEKGPEHMMPMEEPWVLPSMLNPASEDSNHSYCSPEPTEEHRKLSNQASNSE
jgi:hypothetical protein